MTGQGARLRPSRGLRARVKTKKQEPRMARVATLDPRGLVIDGQPIPYYIGPDVSVELAGERYAAITVSVLAESFEVPSARLPRNARLTITEVVA